MTDEMRTIEICRKLYGTRFDLHYDLYERSNSHRLHHGGNCTVYPSSPLNSRRWSLLAAMVEAKRFLEVGCGLGYTAALMAEAGGPGCEVHTIEAVDEHADMAEHEFAQRGLEDRIRVLRGQAIRVLPSLERPYDIIFLDADTNDYPGMLPHLVRLVRQRGLLVTANLSGVFDGNGQERKEEVSYLMSLIADDRFVTHMIPKEWHVLSYRVKP